MLSVSFFIDKRIKPKIFKDASYYPLYVRLYFSGKNTTRKVPDFNGESILMTEADFDQFLKYYEGNTYLDKSSLVNSDAVVILHREDLYRKSFEYFYRNRGDNFNFKEYSQYLKFGERYLDPVLRDSFEKQLMILAEERAQNLHQFQSLNIDSLFYTVDVLGTKRWSDVIFSKPIPDRLLLAGKSWTAWRYTYHQLFEQGGYLFDRKFGAVLPTYRGTVFSWKYGPDQEYFKEINQKVKKIGALPGFFRGDAKEIFMPDNQDVEQYVEYINSVTELYQDKT